MNNFLEILLGISSLVIIISVLLQDSKSEGIAGLSESSNVGGYGKKSSKNYLIDKIVIVTSVIFLITALLLALLSK